MRWLIVSIHGEILGHMDIKLKLKQRNTSSLTKNYLLKESNFRNIAVTILKY